MFRREVKSPPNTELANSRSTAPGRSRRQQLRGDDVGLHAPGWSIRNTRGFAGSATGGIALAGAPAGAFQSPNCFSSSGMISASVVSPTIITVAVSGRSCSACQATGRRGRGRRCRPRSRCR
jgi:hypothetical protein